MMEIIVNAYSTLRHPPPPDFPHEMISARDRTDPELYDHLNGFLGFVSDQGTREITPTLYAVMRHIERIQNHYSFKIDPKLLEQIAGWGTTSNSIFLFPDGNVRDPSGLVLVDHETGAASPGAEVPFPDPSRARVVRTRQRMIDLGITTADDLPPVVSEQEVSLRDPEEVAWRMLALFIVAVRAESLASQQPIPIDKLREKSPMAFQALTPAEQAFLDSETPEPQTVMTAAWRYEALYTLQWALGLHQELEFANEICDVPLVAETMVGRRDQAIVSEARLRSTSEILDALDLNERLLWAARKAVSDKNEPPAGIDGGVLSERQHALNWLVRFGEVPWDDVDTPT